MKRNILCFMLLLASGSYILQGCSKEAVAPPKQSSTGAATGKTGTTTGTNGTNGTAPTTTTHTCGNGGPGGG